MSLPAETVIAIVRGIQCYGAKYQNTEFASGYMLACIDIESRLLAAYGLPNRWREDLPVVPYDPDAPHGQE